MQKKTFPNRNKLKRHISSHCEKPYVCGVCSTTFSKKTVGIIHAQRCLARSEIPSKKQPKKQYQEQHTPPTISQCEISMVGNNAALYPFNRQFEPLNTRSLKRHAREIEASSSRNRGDTSLSARDRLVSSCLILYPCIFLYS